MKFKEVFWTINECIFSDEFLPIMYDRHPNAEWMGSFPRRNLRAFTVYPLVVEPERYTNQPGYVSDTEGSNVVAATKDEEKDNVKQLADVFSNEMVIDPLWKNEL